MKSKDMSRRKFIKKLGTGAVGAGIAFSHLPSGSKAETVQSKDLSDDKKIQLKFTVNNKNVSLYVEPHTTLSQVLREDLELTGTKIVCNHGECGSCTVLVDGKAVYSCHYLALDATGKKVTTIEGLLDGEELNALQEAFVEHDGMQCGFCTSGQIMSAYALLQERPHPTKDEIVKGLSGNLCRCGAYPNIIKSVEKAAKAKV